MPTPPALPAVAATTPSPDTGDGRSASLAALAALVIFNVVLSTSFQDALFLMKHPRQRIPLAMLLGSLLVAGVTLGANRLLRGRSPVWSLRAILGGLALASFGAAAWNRHPTGPSTFALFLFVEVAGTLGAAATWTYFQAPLAPARMRRLMPWLGIWAGVGGLLASGAIRLLLRVAPPAALVWVAAGAWLAAALLVRDGHAPPPGRRRSSARAAGSELARIARLPLARWMALGTAGMLWAGLVVQYELRVTLQERLTAPDIARTMGLLLGGASVLGIATQALVTPRILERRGVGLALSVLPAGLLVCLGGFLATPLLVLIVGASLLDKTLRPNLHRAAESCLVGALPPSLRPALMLALGGIVAPLLKAAGSLLLWAAAPLGRPWLVGAGIAAAAALVALGARWGSIYARGLRATLEEGVVEAPHGAIGAEAVVPLIDGPRLAILLHAVDGGSRRARELALELLRPHRSAMVARAMAERLASPVEAVRIAALHWHSAEPAPALDPRLRARWADPSISSAERVALLAAAGRQAHLLVGDDAGRWLAVPADEPELPRAARPRPNPLRALRELSGAVQARAAGELRAAVAEALYRGGDASLAARGRYGLEAMLASRRPGERTLALAAIGRLGAGELVGAVKARVADPDLAVRRAAVAVLPALDHASPDARAAIWRALDDAALAPTAARALADCGEVALPGILAALGAPEGSPPSDGETVPAGGDRAPRSRPLLVRALGLIPSREAVPALVSHLAAPDRALQLEALRSLDKLHRRDPDLPVDATRLTAYLEGALGFGLRLLRCSEVLGHRAGHRRRGLLHRELDAQIEAAQERVSRALALRSPPDTMIHVFRSLRSPRSPHREQAHELLRALLPPGPLRAGAGKLLDPGGPWPPECLAPGPAPKGGDLALAASVTPAEALAWLRRASPGSPALAFALHHDPDLPPTPRNGGHDAPEETMTPAIETLLFLKDVSLFEELSSAELLEVARLAERVDLPADRRLFAQGDAPDFLFIVCEGKLRVLVEGAGQVARLGPGECVGEMAVLAGSDRSATVETLEPCRLLRFDGDDFLALLDVYPEIGRALLRSLVKRLSHAGRPSEGLHSTIVGMIRSGTAG